MQGKPSPAAARTTPSRGGLVTARGYAREYAVVDLPLVAVGIICCVLLHLFILCFGLGCNRQGE